MSAERSKEFDKRIREMCGRHEIWRVFSDFCELSALSFSNSIIRDEQREQRYLSIAQTYNADEMNRFAELLGVVVRALDDDQEQDFLGSAFMRLELASHWHGQFFTPMEVCRLMARLTVGSKEECEQFIAEKGYINVAEPACGAGALVIAMAGALRAVGVEPQRFLHVTATDLDSTAAHMAYIQLSLLHIPAVVMIGNTLTLEMRGALYTPAHYLGMWGTRLRRSRAEPLPPVVEQPVASVLEELPARLGQLVLL